MPAGRTSPAEKIELTEMVKKEFIVKEEAGLFDCLLSLGFKRTRVKQLLKFRAVSVNGRTVESHDQLMLPGDRVSLSSGKTAVAESVLKLGIKILYEDDAVLVVDKPAGLLTIAQRKNGQKPLIFS